MKESDSVVRSKKKAKTTNNNINGNSKTKVATQSKLLNNNNNNNHHNHKSNGINGNNHTSKNNKASSRSSSAATITKVNNTGIESTKIKKKRLKNIKDRVNNSRKSSSTVTNSTSPRGSRRGNSKSSPELRPRRRASQTYFFKYQLARNPLKAEEEDLKLALLASLQQCGSSTSTNSDSQDDHIDQQHPKTQKQQPNQQQNNHNNQINHHPHNHQNNKVVNYKQPKHEEQLQQVAKAPPKIYDEEYLRKYRPETEDFLTFICFRVTAPNNSLINGIKTEPTADDIDNISNITTHNDTNHLNNCNIYYNTGNKTSEKLTSNDSHNLRRSSSPHKLTANSNASNSSPNPNSPSHRRRPTRQSPRLASSNRKISESDNTAFDTINYEEDMKKASIALEDMAQEINSKDDTHKEVAQNSSDCGTRLSSSSYKNNKHLVKGLMTREFAGGFADEEIIFESISNHML